MNTFPLLKTTIHILRRGLPLCEFTMKEPQYWAANHKWARDAAELRTLKDSEVPCKDCVEKDKPR